MPSPSVSDEHLRQIVAAFNEAVSKGYKPPGVIARGKGEVSALNVVAGLFNKSPSWIHRLLKHAVTLGLHTWPEFDPAKIVIPDKVDEQSTYRFWKSKAENLARELNTTHHLLDELTGLLSRPVAPAAWSAPRPGKKNRACGLLHISDIHGGEVVDPAEIGGLNEFNLDICQKRLRRLFNATIEILPRWSSDCVLEGIYVPLNGDLVSGDIHEELRQTNALTAQQQVWFVADELAGGLTKLADVFGHVYVVVTGGNHGRSTFKTHAKRTYALSYDTMIGEQLRRHFANDKRVTVVVSKARHAVYEILGWKVLQTHNDAGGGGGQGFAGPGLPILRKGKSMEWAAAQRREFYDIILTGHYHTSSNPGKVLGNGSVVGYSEYSVSINAGPEPASQWLALVTDKWPLRERMDVKLQDMHKSG